MVKKRDKLLTRLEAEARASLAETEAEDLARAKKMIAAGIQWEDISREIDKATARGELADTDIIIERLLRGRVKKSQPAQPVYGSRPINGRRRRTKAEIQQLQERLYEILRDDHPMTVRQVFYQMTTRGIAKTEAEYKNTVGRLLLRMRRAGEIPYSWIADNTRWMRKPQSFSSLEEALASTARTYRRSLWDNQDVYVEIWTEKDALAGVLLEETWRWDVPLMVSRGFSSATYLYEAAQAIKAANKPAFLYYFGDHDPSGVHIDRAIERGLHEHAPEAEIYFKRVAVTPEQIEDLNLPTRPTKRTTKMGRSFEGDSVEVDAIPSRQLRELAANCIQQHIDQAALDVLRVAEKSEREILERLTKRIGKQKPSTNGKAG